MNIFFISLERGEGEKREEGDKRGGSIPARMDWF
jgi:hypothetical protein